MVLDDAVECGKPHGRGHGSAECLASPTRASVREVCVGVPNQHNPNSSGPVQLLQSPAHCPCGGPGQDAFTVGLHALMTGRGGISSGDSFGTPPILVRGHQTRETSTPPTKKCGLFCTRTKLTHSRRRPTSHSQRSKMNGRDEQTDSRQQRNNTGLPPPESQPPSPCR